MSGFNPKAARAKRPCPLWIDAFQRDTQHLEADEVGCYLLILMAMWTRETCDFPDDDSRLARISRVSIRLWKSRIGPTLRPFFETANGVLISKRLRQEAAYTERQVKRQSDRRASENSDKPLEHNEPMQSADTSVDQPRHQPTQLPNYPTVKKEATAQLSPTSARKAAAYHERCLSAARIDVTRDVSGKWFASTQQWITGRWRSDLGLTDAEIEAVIAEVVSRNGAAPATMAYFDRPMADAAARKAAPPLQARASGQARSPAPSVFGDGPEIT